MASGYNFISAKKIAISFNSISTHTLWSSQAEVDLNFAYLIDFVFAQYHGSQNANTHLSICGSLCKSADFGQGWEFRAFSSFFFLKWHPWTPINFFYKRPMGHIALNSNNRHDKISLMESYSIKYLDNVVKYM